MIFQKTKKLLGGNGLTKSSLLGLTIVQSLGKVRDSFEK